MFESATNKGIINTYIEMRRSEIMKVEFINPFIKATTGVLKTLTDIDFVTGKPYVKASPYTAKEVLIIVGITGEIRGQVVITLDVAFAKKMASMMMMGMPVDELDELSKSALSELGNMIMGNTATLLFNEGVSVDITPPTLMVGQQLSISSGSMRTICIPLTAPGLGELILDLSIKE